MDKISKKELDNFLSNWKNLKTIRDLRARSQEAARIDKNVTARRVRTKDEIRQADIERKRLYRRNDLNARRKYFEDYLKRAHYMTLEELAWMYHKQDRKCECGNRIRLEMDYRIVPGKIICSNCAN